MNKNIPKEIILMKFFQATWGLDNLNENIFRAFETMMSDENMKAFVENSNSRYMQLKYQYDELKKSVEQNQEPSIDDKIALDEKRLELEAYNQWHNRFLRDRDKFVDLLSSISEDEVNQFNTGVPIQVKVHNTLYIAQKGSVLEVNCGLGQATPKYLDVYHKEIVNQIFDNLSDNNEKL